VPPRTPQNQSTQANRKSLIEDHQKTKTTHREIARLSKQKKLAENLREKIENEENGVDGERKKNWGWTIEQNQRWLKAEEEKQERGKEEFDGESFRGVSTSIVPPMLIRRRVFL
jgi:pre-mRNA-splicing factor SYF2